MTFSFLPRSIRCKSVCNRSPRKGSSCQSTSMAASRAPLEIATWKMVLCPAAECRIWLICLVLTLTGTASLPPPYKTAGISPRRRKRRASFLPRASRGLASTVISLVISASLQKHSADRCLLVNGLDSPRQQRCNAKLADAVTLPGLGLQRDGVADDELLQPGLTDPLHRRTGKHRMRAAGVDCQGAVIEE